MGNPIGVVIPFEGGLDLVTPDYILAKNPGSLKKMVNFESALGGGYRRINGYKQWSTATPSGSATRLYGVCQYADGIVAVQVDSGNYNIYFTTDGTTWTQVNKIGASDASGGLTLVNLNAAAQTTRTVGSKQIQFVLYEGNTEYGELFILDGANKVAWFKITGTTTKTYFYDEISTFTTAQWGTVYKDHLVVGGDSTNKETVYWSDAFAPTSFTGGTSGSLKFTDKITGVKAWRDRLFIFGQNGVSELSGINGVPSVTSISRNMGCVSGYTIQEIGGDLIWLSPDGFRNLAGTERIDDIELGTISRKINPLIEDILVDINVEDISSFAIRERNQYRMFHCKSTYTSGQQMGLVGTYKAGSQGLSWEWGELQGIPVACAWSGVNKENAITSLDSAKEIILHGGYDGHVYLHDDPNTTSFAGSTINAYFETAPIDYGDIGIKKTIRWVNLNGTIEGPNSDVWLKLIYDYDDTGTQQPNPYPLAFYGTFSYYGTGLYGTAYYSKNGFLNYRILVEGSGFINSFKVYSDNTQGGYTISGLYVRAHVGKSL